MIKSTAERLTEICLERKLVDTELSDWCRYVIEKWLNIFFFFCIVVIWMCFSGTWLETSAFLAPFYLLRRRMGGYHAKTPAVCFTISILLVVSASRILVPVFVTLPAALSRAAAAASYITAFFTYPAYPPQLNFTDEEKAANNSRKKLLLCVLFILQLIGTRIFGARLLWSSTFGVIVAVSTVNIQKKYKGEKQNEEI